MKQIIHFDSVNNTNFNSSTVYDNCTLKINNPIRNPKSIKLKSFELPLRFGTSSSTTQNFEFTMSYTKPKYVLPSTLNWNQYFPLYGVLNYQEQQNTPQFFHIDVYYPIFPITVTHPTFTLSGEIFYNDKTLPSPFSISLSFSSHYSYTSTTTNKNDQYRCINLLLNYINGVVASHHFSFTKDSNYKISLKTINANVRGINFNNVKSGTNIDNIFRIFGDNSVYSNNTTYFPIGYLFTKTGIQYDLSAISSLRGTLHLSTTFQFILKTSKATIKDIIKAVNSTVANDLNKLHKYNTYYINNYDENTIAYMNFALSTAQPYETATNSLVYTASNNGFDNVGSFFSIIQFQYNFLSNNSIFGINLSEHTTVTFERPANLKINLTNPIQYTEVVDTIKKVFPVKLNQTSFSTVYDLVNYVESNGLPSIPNRNVNFYTDGNDYYITNSAKDETSFTDWITIYDEIKNKDIFRLGFIERVFYAADLYEKTIVPDVIRPSTSLRDPSYSSFTYRIPITLDNSIANLDDYIDSVNTQIISYLNTFNSGTSLIKASVSTHQLYDISMIRYFNVLAHHDGRKINISFQIKDALLASDDFINGYNPYLDGGKIDDWTTTYGIVPNIVLNSLSKQSGLRETTQTPYFQDTITQIIYFKNTYIVPIQTYVIAYIKNIKTPNSSAVGFNATFKIPLQQGRATNAETGELTYFFNDITFRQKLHITDKTTSIDQIIISLYDRYNNLLTSDERDYSFSLEFCDYDSDSDTD